MSKFLNILAPATGGALGAIGLAYVLADQFVVDIPAPVRGVVTPSAANAQSAEAETPAAPDPQLASATRPEGGFGLGREAMPEEIAAWNIDIRPDGQGLPVGSGDVWTGEELYTDYCAVCHGDFGEAVGRWPQLAGGHGSLTNDRPVKTVGSYWPYLSTVFDYVHRAMPFGAAQSLTDDEVYAITAYVLYLNDLVGDDFTLSKENFTEVEMPNEGNFFMDDRLEVEFPQFTGEACMTDCKDTVEITARAAVVDVTPEETAAREAREAARATVQETEVAAVPPEETAPAAAPEAAEGPDPELVAAGEQAFRKCSACHQIGEGASNRVGPVLTGIVGAPAAAVDGFRYSSAMETAGEEGLVWTEEELTAFLTKPREYMNGTKMSFAGFRKSEEVEAVIAYLRAAE